MKFCRVDGRVVFRHFDRTGHLEKIFGSEFGVIGDHSIHRRSARFFIKPGNFFGGSRKIGKPVGVVHRPDGAHFLDRFGRNDAGFELAVGIVYVIDKKFFHAPVAKYQECRNFR